MWRALHEWNVSPDLIVDMILLSPAFINMNEIIDFFFIISHRNVDISRFINPFERTCIAYVKTSSILYKIYL